MVIQRGWLFGVHRIRVQWCGCGNLGCKACCAPQILLTWPTFIDIYDAHFDMTMIWHLCGTYVAFGNTLKTCVPNVFPNGKHWPNMGTCVPMLGNAYSLCSHTKACMFPCVPKFPYWGTFVPMFLDWKMFISICSHLGDTRFHMFPHGKIISMMGICVHM